MALADYSKPKNGDTYRVLEFSRISTPNQDELSLDDQQAYGRNHLERIMPDAKFEYTSISGQGSGQLLDRREFEELCELLETGAYDIVVAEDLGRILRRIQSYLFCEEAEDQGTRVIAINDYVDTKDEGWRQAAFFASYKHASFCRETSKRIRRSHRNRFLQGGVFQCEIFGYVKPKAKATDEEVHKDPDAESIYDHWFTMLESGCSYANVADWLNSKHVPTGPYCTQDLWTGTMVGRITHNPILKGIRYRNRSLVSRKNKTGRPESVKAPPEQWLERKVPHLAFIDAERYDALIRKLKIRNQKYRRAESEQNDPRAGVPRRRTIWPGQHLRCGVCGRLFVFGGHGKKMRMMCNGAREYRCWNGMTVDSVAVSKAVCAQVRDRISSLPEFDEDWRTTYEEQRSRWEAEQNSTSIALDSKLKQAIAESDRLFELARRVSLTDANVAKTNEAEALVRKLQDKLQDQKRRQKSSPQMPTLEEVNESANRVFLELPSDSEEFGRHMLRVISDFFVLPYRLADGGHVQPRVTFRASLGALVEGNADLQSLQFDGVVDLAKRPKKAIYLDDVVRMVTEGQKHADVAEQLGIFKTEVGYAMHLHRRMVAIGTADPWVPMKTAEQVADYFKRVRNHRFKFEPLAGFETTKHP